MIKYINITKYRRNLFLIRLNMGKDVKLWLNYRLLSAFIGAILT